MKFLIKFLIKFGGRKSVFPKTPLFIILFIVLLGSLAQTTKNAAYYHELAESEEQQHQYIKAIELYKRSLSINANFTASRLALGRLFRITGAFHHSRENLLAALKLEPNNLAILTQLVLLHQEQNNITNSETYLQQALKLAPFDPTINFLQAQQYLLQDKVYLASQKLESILSSNPNHHLSMIALGEALTRQKQFARAEALFQKALQIAPEEPQVFVNIAKIQIEKALRHVQAPPDENQAWQTYFEDAQATLQNAIAFQGDYIPANMLAGKLHYLLGNLNTAQNHFQLVNRIQPANSGARYLNAIAAGPKGLNLLIQSVNDNENDEVARFFYQKLIRQKYDRPLADRILQQARYHSNNSKLLQKNNLYEESFFEALLSRELSNDFIEARKSLLEFYRLKQDYTAYEIELLYLRKATNEQIFIDMHEQLQRINRSQLIFTENITSWRNLKSPTPIFIFWPEPKNYLGNYPNAGEALHRYVSLALRDKGRVDPNGMKQQNFMAPLTSLYPLQVKYFANENSLQQITNLSANKIRYSITSQFSETDNGLSVNLKIYDHHKGTSFAPLTATSSGKGFLRKIAMRIADHVYANIPFNGKIIKIQGDTIIVNLGKREKIQKNSKLFVLNNKNQKIPLKIQQLDYDFLSAQTEKNADMAFIKTNNSVFLGK